MKEKFLFILVILVLITGPALAAVASPVDDVSDFGTSVVIPLTTTSPAGAFFGFAITVEASVYLQDGVYTYVYSLSDNETGTHAFLGEAGISSFAIAAPDFDPTLGWGTVGGVPSNLNVTFVGGMITFQFSPNLPSGSGIYTVYAQSTMAPLLYTFSGSGLGTTGEGAITWGADPIHDTEPIVLVAEVSSFFFLSFGLLGLGLLRQKFS